jgi:hypothetical protein
MERFGNPHQISDWRFRLNIEDHFVVFVHAAPGARFVVGMTYMNVDVARLLEEEYSKQKGRDT